MEEITAYHYRQSSYIYALLEPNMKDKVLKIDTWITFHGPSI